MIRVMLVEDEPSALRRYCSYVEEQGEDFIITARCATAEEALTQFQESPPEVVLTDVRLPGEDGLSMLARMKDAGWGGLSVIISGYDDFSFARKAIQLTVLDYLLKPVFPEDMRKLLANIRRRFEETGYQTHGTLSARIDKTKVPVFVKRAVAYVETYSDRAVSLEDVAESVYVSPAYLSASFKKHCGCSLSDFARHCRIDRARRLIETTDFPLKVVAEQLGFPDIASFSKLFCKVTGTSPGAYRSKCRGT